MNEHLNKALLRICKYGCMDIVRALIKCGATLDEQCLIAAGRYGQIETFKFILNCELDYTLKSPFKIAMDIYANYAIWMRQMNLNKVIAKFPYDLDHERALRCRLLFEDYIDKKGILTWRPKPID